MKRFSSTILIGLILMNVMGYYGLLVGLQYQNDRDLARRIISGTYEDDETINLKIPMVAVTPGSVGEEQLRGEFMKQGDVYKLIRQKLYRDTFHIVAIRDKTGTFIKHAMTEYTKTFSDNAKDDDSPSLIVLPVFIKEYLQKPFSISSGSYGWTASISPPQFERIFFDSFAPSIIHPPNI